MGARHRSSRSHQEALNARRTSPIPLHLRLRLPDGPSIESDRKPESRVHDRESSALTLLDLTREQPNNQGLPFAVGPSGVFCATKQELTEQKKKTCSAFEDLDDKDREYIGFL